MLLLTLEQRREWGFLVSMFINNHWNIWKFDGQVCSGNCIAAGLGGSFYQSEKIDGLCSRYTTTVTCNSNLFSVLYATNVKFHQTNLPHGDQPERKLFYSGKHHIFGYKIKVIFALLAFAIYTSKNYLGSVVDVTIFCKTIKYYVIFTTRNMTRGTYLTSMVMKEGTDTGVLCLIKDTLALREMHEW